MLPPTANPFNTGTPIPIPWAALVHDVLPNPPPPSRDSIRLDHTVWKQDGGIHCRLLRHYLEARGLVEPHEASGATAKAKRPLGGPNPVGSEPVPQPDSGVGARTGPSAALPDGGDTRDGRAIKSEPNAMGSTPHALSQTAAPALAPSPTPNLQPVPAKPASWHDVVSQLQGAPKNPVEAKPEESDELGWGEAI